MVSKRAEFDGLKASMLELLPEDGTPVLNRVMRVMLARNLARPINEEAFFRARDELFESGLIGRSRGQGGQIYLSDRHKSKEVPSKQAASPDALSEAKLMAPLQKYLEGPFASSLESGACIVQDTSTMGPYKGRWARPDFILVSAMRFKLLPGSQVDVHSFELKTEVGGGVLAIHEALAQTRFTHFGHFVWHLPEGSKNETQLDDIVTHCEEHGIGLIRMQDPFLLDSYNILVDPRRKPTLSAVVDGFLESRLSSEQKDILLESIRGDV